MSLKSTLAAASLAVALPVLAEASPAVDVEVLDRATGRALPVYWHAGERYVAGEPGREYEIRLRNPGGARVLAVTSVDGVNVITGRTASTAGSGYVIDPWGQVAIDGWRKSLDAVAAFYFTALPDSYAARTGRPDDVGVIGIALFSEAVPPMSEAYGAARTALPAPAVGAAAESKSRQRAEDAAVADERLGTGHGQRLDSGAQYTHFERASERPDAVIRIFYDSRRNLVAQGVIPRHDRLAQRRPEPFPAEFAPDP